ncbi:MAG: C10 family peptidase [Prevotella sp.]|nr:C10 family peptidase [Prevotella sp.]
MQKKTILFIMMLTIGLIPINAKIRTKSEMQTIASRVISVEKTEVTRGSNTLYECYSTPVLSMFTTTDGAFAVIASDDAYEAVLGYSTTKGNEMETLPDGLVWWMNAISQAIETKTANIMATDVLRVEKSGFAEEIAPLVTSTWNQGNPYNYMCPQMASKGNYPTGCVATALSQIMRYHQYPKQGQGSYTYVFRPDDGTAYQLTANFGETIYDWDNMLDSYKSGYTDAQRDAVALLMSHCGISVNMSYNPSGSGAYSEEATNALRTYFRYNENVRLYRRDFYSAAQWMNILYTELNNQRPVYYCGVDPNGGGHAFVIDGYDAQGLVHVNWGWGGKSDGYFDIALLNPSGSKYTDGQEMIGNICKPEIERPYISQLGAAPLNINVYGSTTKRLTISASVYDVGADDFEGTIAAIIQNDRKTIVAKKQEGVSLKAASLGFYKPIDVSLKSIDLTDIPDGTYRIYLGCRSEKDNAWQLVRAYKGEKNSCILTKTGSEYKVEDSTDDMWTETVNISKGDANGDGEVNVTDVVFVIEAIGKDYETHKAADVNSDGAINVADVIYIIKRIK